MKITNHARKRAKQSGLNDTDIHIIIKYGSYDIGKHQRRCYSIQTSTDKACLFEHLLNTTGTISSEHAKRLINATAVVSKDGWIVTAFTTNLNNNTQITQKPFEVIKGG